jgi:hypothetical protein
MKNQKIENFEVRDFCFRMIILCVRRTGRAAQSSADVVAECAGV